MRLALAIFTLSLASLASGSEPDFAKVFSGKEGCFILYDLKAKKTVTEFNPKRCAERIVACSTFKIPLAVMAFDRGILKENTPLKWDGKKHEIEAWNHDQTPASWIRDSVVWVSQRITPELGLPAIKDYLEKFDYGTQDMSGGITTAWLTSGPNPPTLKISAQEQIYFLKRLWNETLPVSKHAQALTKKLTYLETSTHGAILHGKTGSTIPAEALTGWFVGHLTKGDQDFVFALNYTGPAPKTGPRFAGMIAKGMAKELLEKMGLF